MSRILVSTGGLLLVDVTLEELQHVEPIARIREEVHAKLEPAVVTFLLPVFFVVVGLATRIDLLRGPYLWGITLLFIATAIAGKWGGAWSPLESPERRGATPRRSAST